MMAGGLKRKCRMKVTGVSEISDVSEDTIVEFSGQDDIIVGEYAGGKY